MAIGEHGEDIGRTWGDLLGEVQQAVLYLVEGGGADRMDGKDWKVYRVGQTLLRIDIEIEADRPS